MTTKKRTSICHELKCWPQWYNLITRRMMDSQVRKADKDFQPGDTCHIREYDPMKKAFTGHSCHVRIVLIVDDMPGVKDGYITIYHRLIGGKPAAPQEHKHMGGMGE